MPGDLKVSNGSTYVAAKTVAVSNGSSYVTAKGVYVSDGAGNWRLSWPNLSTVSVTGPAYAMSTSSGGNSSVQSWNTIVSPTFTISLSNPGAVSRVSFQLHHETFAADRWDEYKGWDSGFTTTMTYTMPFYTTGAWTARTVITHTSGSTVTSNIHALSCVAFSISALCDTATPQVGAQTSVWAGMSPSAPGGFPNAPEGWYISRNGAAYQRPTDWGWSNTANPLYWTPGDTATFRWVWVESFPDGSRIHSNLVDQAPVVAEDYYWVNGDATTIQNALNLSAANGQTARFGGTFSGGTGVRIPAGSRVVCDAGTVFYGIQFFNGYPAAGVPDGGYNRAGNIVWTGGIFDMQMVRSTAFSISHCPSFQLHGATIYNTLNADGQGHGIEINSSGGAAVGGDVRNMAEWQFTIQVVGCRFGGFDVVNYANRPRANCNDEAMHMDYAWGNSATAAGSVNDGTSCHNILFKGNRVERMHGNFYNYPVGVGNHKTTGTAPEVDMSSNHGPIRVDGNVFVACGPFAGSDQHRGSVDLRGIRNVQVVSNTFSISATGFGINAQTGAGGVPQGYIYVHSNIFESCGHWQERNGTNYSISRAWTDTNTDPVNNPNSEHVYIYENTFTGWVGGNQGAASDGGQYLVCNDDVDTLQILRNRFWGLTGNGSYTAQTSNRIYGSTAAPPASVSGYLCSDNTWSPNANGSGAVVSNS